MNRVLLWCENARGECSENTREACKLRGVAEYFNLHTSRVFPQHSPSALTDHSLTARDEFFYLFHNI